MQFDISARRTIYEVYPLKDLFRGRANALADSGYRATMQNRGALA